MSLRLSTKARYGLRIMVQMAVDNINGKKLSRGKMIAKKQDITEAYLEQIMIPLKRGGIVGALRGCNGGYELRKSPDDVTVLDVIELFEGGISLAECFKGDTKCKRLEKCPTAHVWTRLSGIIRKEARIITLASIVKDYRENTSGDYII